MLIKDPALSPYVIKYDFNGFSVGEEDAPKHRDWQRVDGLQQAVGHIVSKKLAAIDRTVSLGEFAKIEQDLRNAITKAFEQTDVKEEVETNTQPALTIAE